MIGNEIKSGKLEDTASKVFPSLCVEPSMSCTKFSEKKRPQKIVDEDEEAYVMLTS